MPNKTHPLVGKPIEVRHRVVGTNGAVKASGRSVVRKVRAVYIDGRIQCSHGEPWLVATHPDGTFKLNDDGQMFTAG